MAFLGPHKIGEINPEAYLVWEPNASTPSAAATAYNDGSNQPDQADGPSTRHDTGCIVASFDGHVQILPFNAYANLMENKQVSPNYLWADPDSPLGDGVGCTLK